MKVEFFIAQATDLDPAEGQYFALLKWTCGFGYKLEWGVVEYRKQGSTILAAPKGMPENLEQVEVVAYGLCPNVTESTTYSF